MGKPKNKKTAHAEVAAYEAAAFSLFPWNCIYMGWCIQPLLDKFQKYLHSRKQVLVHGNSQGYYARDFWSNPHDGCIRLRVFKRHLQREYRYPQIFADQSQDIFHTAAVVYDIWFNACVLAGIDKVLI